MNKFKNIQWYPGHMFKTFKQLKNELKLIDVVLVCLDARAPKSSKNPMIEELLKDKNCIYILNKFDLSDKSKTLEFIENNKNKNNFIAINSKVQETRNKVIKKINNVMNLINKKREKKGLKPKISRVMITGIPNVGKSTLLNNLVRKKITKTGDVPGITKSLQWIRIDKRIEVLDTPGVLWPKFDNKNVALNLALIGSIKDKVLPIHEIFDYGIKYIKTNYYKRLVDRYQINENKTEEESIAEKFGALGKDNSIDTNRVHLIFLNDLRSGKLGGITLDEV